MASDSERKVIIVGKTGNGKSSLGNTLLRRRSFEVGDGFDAVTLKSQLGANVDGLTVVDTPGLFDTRDDPKRVLNGALEIISALDICPKPHAFLIVFNGACRLTEEEMSVIDILRISFGNAWIKQAIVVITHIDNDVEDFKFENKWKKCETLRKFVEECGRRVARIDNKHPMKEHIDKIFMDIEHVSNNGMMSFDYSYMECHKEVLSNAAELELYNGKSTHQFVEQLARSVDDKVQKETERRQVIEAIKKEKEWLKSKAKKSFRKKVSAIGSATAGVVTGLATAGATTTAAASVSVIAVGSLCTGGIVGVIALGLFGYYYIKPLYDVK